MDSATAELILPIEWDNNNDLMDEELSATSSEEASRVFEQWKTDNTDQDFDAIMEVDEQIGSDLLGEEIFFDPCMSPTGPLEELVGMSFDDEDVDRFSLSLLSNFTAESTSYLPFDERYKATLRKLSESMRRSQETRASLKMKTLKTEDYSRTTSISGVLTSIEKSTHQLQVYLKKIERV